MRGDCQWNNTPGGMANLKLPKRWSENVYISLLSINRTTGKHSYTPLSFCTTTMICEKTAEDSSTLKGKHNTYYFSVLDGHRRIESPRRVWALNAPTTRKRRTNKTGVRTKILNPICSNKAKNTHTTHLKGKQNTYNCAVLTRHRQIGQPKRFWALNTPTTGKLRTDKRGSKLKRLDKG